MAVDCTKLQAWLLRQTPNFAKELSKDMLPRDLVWLNFYPKQTWASFRGTEFTKDRIHVTMPNDPECWDDVDADDCPTLSPCDPSRSTLGWGTSRKTWKLQAKDYQTPVLCFDQLRHVEQAVAKIAAIIEGLKKMPEYIVGNWMRTWIMRGSNQIYIAGSALTTVTTNENMFTNDCRFVDLGSTSNFPTSKLTVPFLNYWQPDLQFNGYFDGDFTPTGKYQLVTDMVTAKDLANGNPALSAMYDAADFEKGGKFFQYGAMMGVGNDLLKIDPYPARFQQVGGSSVLERVWPYDNIPTTVGKEPQVSQTYKNACYQLSVVPSMKARTVYVGDTTPVNAAMPFAARELFGKMQWISPYGSFVWTGPDGTPCTYDNVKRNKGYFLLEYEAGVENEYPERELAILHLREPDPVVDVPLCRTCDAQQQIYPYPYNDSCEQE